MDLSQFAQIVPAPSDSALRSSREAILGLFFQETDRMQRMKTPLSVVLLSINGSPPSDFRASDGEPEEVVHEFFRRMAQLLRSYDRMGRTAKNKFLLLLPGCSEKDARMLAERIHATVFNKPFELEDESIALHACFGIAGSYGRSPIVVLQHAETALQAARRIGTGSIQTYEECPPATLR